MTMQRGRGSWWTALAAMAAPLEKESRKGAAESLEKLRALLT